jgi:hypothetical protein
MVMDYMDLMLIKLIVVAALAFILGLMGKLNG